MAAAGGPPQNDTKAKKEITPEQRKLYIQLGVIGVLALIAGVIYLPGLFKGSSSTTVATAPTTNVVSTDAAPPAEGGGPPGTTTDAEGGAAPAPAAATTASVVTGPVMRSRTDPFVKLYFIPTPTPLPPPVPPPVSIPFPEEPTRISLPGVAGGGAAMQPLVLPPVTINRLNESTRRPTDAFPPRRSAGEGSGGGTINPSFDKRLSGVVIGDGVRAILEIQRGTELVTHVVQPGDEVDGITVLNIQRFNDGTRNITRMIIRENGEERSVDLRPSAQPLTGAGGGPGAPGQGP